MELGYFLINGLGGPFACHMGHIGLRSPTTLAPSLNMPSRGKRSQWWCHLSHSTDPIIVARDGYQCAHLEINASPHAVPCCLGVRVRRYLKLYNLHDKCNILHNITQLLGCILWDQVSCEKSFSFISGWCGWRTLHLDHSRKLICEHEVV